MLYLRIHLLNYTILIKDMHCNSISLRPFTVVKLFFFTDRETHYAPFPKATSLINHCRHCTVLHTTSTNKIILDLI